MNLASLHTHTILSDGVFTYKEVLDLAKNNGISHIGFTDHDTLPNEEKLKELEVLRNHPTKWTIGIELTSEFPEDLKKTGARMFHILGYGVDPRNPDLVAYCNKVSVLRVETAKRTVAHLQANGINITIEDCLKEATGPSLGQPHIVKALTAKVENVHLMEKLIAEIKIKSETDPKIKEKYDLLIQQGVGQYPYALFLRSDAFYPSQKSKEALYPGMDQIVKLIRNAGGVAVIAHYYSIAEAISYELIENYLVDKRIDGMETIFGAWAYVTDKKEEMIEFREKIKELLERHNAIEGGGGDLHFQEDFERFGRDLWYSEGSKTLPEELKKKANLQEPWTSF